MVLSAGARFSICLAEAEKRELYHHRSVVCKGKGHFVSGLDYYMIQFTP